MGEVLGPFHNVWTCVVCLFLCISNKSTCCDGTVWYSKTFCQDRMSKTNLVFKKILNNYCLLIIFMLIYCLKNKVSITNAFEINPWSITQIQMNKLINEHIRKFFVVCLESSDDYILQRSLQHMVSFVVINCAFFFYWIFKVYLRIPEDILQFLVVWTLCHSCIFIFAADGTISIHGFNMSGLTHDSTAADSRFIYDKFVKMYYETGLKWWLILPSGERNSWLVKINTKWFICKWGRLE